MSVPLSAVHAAVFAINEAIGKGQAEGTMKALSNPNAMLRNTQVALAQEYQDALSPALKIKENQPLGPVTHVTVSLPQKSFSSAVKLVEAQFLFSKDTLGADGFICYAITE